MRHNGAGESGHPRLWDWQSLRTSLRRVTAGRLWRLVVPLGLAVVILVGSSPAPVASGPRPPVPLAGSYIGGPYQPARPFVGARFTTLPFTANDGTPGIWHLVDDDVPLHLVVEKDAVERFGRGLLDEALTSWNGTTGSRFEVVVDGEVDDHVDRPRRDGVSRVFMDTTTCGERFLARSHLYPVAEEVRPGGAIAWVDEVDISICERLDPARAPNVLRHEVAHVAGLGHLCNPDEGCWVPAMGTDTQCRIMNTAAFSCQGVTDGDRDAFAYLYPKLRRVAGVNRLGTLAAVSQLLHPAIRKADTVVVTAADAPAALHASATTLATALSAPVLAMDDRCTDSVAGEELNRVAAVSATVLLVGDVSKHCADQLRAGWDLPVERLPDAAAVTRRMLEPGSDGTPPLLAEPTRVVVFSTDDRADVLPDAALAVPVATAMGAPLVPLESGSVPGLLRDLVRRYPTIKVAVVIGGASPPLSADARTALTEDLGLRLRELDARALVPAAVKIAHMRDVFPRSAGTAVVVDGGRPADAMAAATLAAATGAPLLPVWSGAPDERIETLLTSQMTSGFVVGGVDAVPAELQMRLSQALDGGLPSSDESG